jgi:hypothetical protein
VSRIATIRHGCALAWVLLIPAAAAAYDVHWEPRGGSLAVGETSSIELVFDDCEPKGAPDLPAVDGLRLEYAGQSNKLTVTGGEYSRSVDLTYAALVTRNQAIEIPSFFVATNQGAVRVPAVDFQPTSATVGGGQSLESAANSQLTAKPATVWAGQVFDLDYEIQVDSTYYPDFGRGILEWNSQPLVAEDWPAGQRFNLNSGGQPWIGLVYRTRALARAPGSIRLNPISQIINLSIGVSGFGFWQRQYQQFSVTSNAPTIEVRALPPVPDGFHGAVGHFHLSSRVVPTQATVGAPITWTLELSGNGNWPDISGLPTRQVSKDFQVIQPRPKWSPVPGKLFDGKLSEDAVLMPTKPGVYGIDSVTFVYFDPELGQYETLSTPPSQVTVAGAPAPPPGISAPSGEDSSASGAVAAPEAPSGLPRDPLPEGGAAELPSGPDSVLIWALAPFSLTAGLWIALAFLRARQSDPWRLRREARRRLASLLARMEAAPATGYAAPLREWERETALLWGVSHAAPTSDRLPSSWSNLWAEADRALYGPEGKLPPDWRERARQALAEAHPPAFDPRRLWFPRNLLPWFFASMLILVLPLRADDAAAEYRRGDFAAAERGFRSALAANPRDWSARYDLSLALAQQSRWAESVGYAAGAMVQNPADTSVRWQFAVACDKAGFAPQPLAPFLSPGPFETLAGWASPALWQRLVAAAGWLAAAALGVLLLAGYDHLPKKPAAWAGGAALALAIILASTALLGWQTYGCAADQAAAVIWRSGTLRSVPTEADAAQKTVPLAGGSTGLIDKRFLGWVRLVFPNGQTGWVRREETIPLWP